MEELPEPAPQKPLVGCLAAVQSLARILRPCYGPHGLQKLLVTARGDAVPTDCTAAILDALQLDHPAARLVRDTAQSHAEQSGDGVAFVVLLAAALLEQAEGLLRAGLPRSRLREAYAAAAAETQALLPGLAVRALGPFEDPFWVLHSVLGTHARAHARHLSGLLAQACWAAQGPDGTFEPARVRVCALPGGRPDDSCLLGGLALAGGARGQVQEVLDGARLALLACPFGPAAAHAPATPRLASSPELAGFEKGCEQLLERHVGQLAAARVNVVVVWGDVDERTLAHADRHRIMVVQTPFRRELVYLGQALGTPLLPCLIPPPRPGLCQRVYQQVLGQSSVTVLEGEPAAVPTLSLVLRGSSWEGLRDAEQAAHQAVQAYVQLGQDARLLPGAGATEMALAAALTDKGRRLEGPEGPAFLAFAKALRSLPETLARNSGSEVAQVLADLHTAQRAGNILAGVGSDGAINADEEGVWDVLITKAQGLRAVTDITLQLVDVDEIVLARAHPLPEQDACPNPPQAKRHPPAAGKKGRGKAAR
ncbi:T-complex protein 1 subunit theta-like 2 [Sorex araneus]|uniref:T-complex protein 1 subunit theta-like 2 n=1 Tax=Sorex araneus TaxID=42254 RepID=UPI002433464A|nr:T-complex protein 1 subunit theta-like 2 [Sorex araneus]